MLPAIPAWRALRCGSWATAVLAALHTARPSFPHCAGPSLSTSAMADADCFTNSSMRLPDLGPPSRQRPFTIRCAARRHGLGDTLAFRGNERQRSMFVREGGRPAAPACRACAEANGPGLVANVPPAGAGTPSATCRRGWSQRTAVPCVADLRRHPAGVWDIWWQSPRLAERRTGSAGVPPACGPKARQPRAAGTRLQLAESHAPPNVAHPTRRSPLRAAPRRR